MKPLLILEAVLYCIAILVTVATVALILIIYAP
jgi:hypothetical protein